MLQAITELGCVWAPCVPDGGVPAYMGMGYQSMLAANDHAEARVLACHAGKRSALLPLLVRDIGGGCKEAYSAYGYGGLLGDLSLSAPDVDAVKRYLADDGIIALFIRHSPFLANEHAWPSDIVKLNRHTYAVDLHRDDTLDTCLARARQKIRWSANFARRSGLKVTFHPLDDCPDHKVRAFHAQYRELMTRKGTSDYYLFSETFFLDHATRLGDRCELAEVTDAEDRFLGGAFFLLDDAGWAHYHLSAARQEAMKLQGMELLMMSAIHRYGQHGYRSMHIGGGHTLDESDGLSRFKSKFASRTLDFSCSALVCDEAAYQRERSARTLANPSFFLISDARGH